VSRDAACSIDSPVTSTPAILVPGEKEALSLLNTTSWKTASTTAAVTSASDIQLKMENFPTRFIIFDQPYWSCEFYQRLPSAITSARIIKTPQFGYTYCMEPSYDLTPERLQELFPLSLLDDQTLKEHIPELEILYYPARTLIYSQDDLPEEIYLVLSGEVELTSTDRRSTSRVTTCTRGDILGEEALSATNYRAGSALCKTPVELVRLDLLAIQSLRRQSPDLNQAFTLLHNTSRFKNRLFLPWLQKGEQINLISRRHPFFLWLRVILIGGASILGFAILLGLSLSPQGINTMLMVLSLVMLLLGMLLTAWSALEWSNDYFVITSDRVLVQKTLIGFFDSRQESPYNAILSTGLESSFWGRLIGFGTINLKSYTGKLSFKRLPHPEIIYELLELQREKTQQESKDEDKNEMKEVLQKRFQGKKASGELHADKPVQNSLMTAYTSGSLLGIAARFFGLRTRTPDCVTYRTHWWILFKKTLLPALFLLLVIIFVVTKLLGFFPSLPDTASYLVALIVTFLAWCWWFYQYLDWYNDVYLITADQLIDVNRKPLGKEERRSAPLKNIQTVEFLRKGIIGLVLNYGTVRIQIGNEELTFDNVYDPAAIQSEIFSHFRQFNQRARRMEQEKIADWIKTYDEMKKDENNRPGDPPKSG
jgi:CRP-like cAMP-binding protein